MLVETMERRHPNLFHDMTRGEWDAAVAELDASIPNLAPDEPERLLVEVMRLAALPASRGGRTDTWSRSRHSGRRHHSSRWQRTSSRTAST